MLQVRLEFVFEFATPNTFAAGAGSGGIACLYHEALNNSVKYVTVVVAVLRVDAEILYSLGDVLAEEIHVDVAKRRVNNRGIVYLLYIRGFRGGYDVLLGRFFVEDVSVAFLTLRVFRFSSREHVEAIFLVGCAKQRRIGSVHLQRGIFRSLHFDGHSGGLSRFTLKHNITD